MTMDLKYTNGVFVLASNQPSLPVLALWEMVHTLRPPGQIQVNHLEPVRAEKKGWEKGKSGISECRETWVAWVAQVGCSRAALDSRFWSPIEHLKEKWIPPLLECKPFCQAHPPARISVFWKYAKDFLLCRFCGCLCE